MIGKPIILISHSQGGGMGFDVSVICAPSLWRARSESGRQAGRKSEPWTRLRFNTPERIPIPGA